MPTDPPILQPALPPPEPVCRPFNHAGYLPATHDHLTALRNALCLSYADIASTTGISLRTVGRYLSGDARLPYAVRRLLIIRYGYALPSVLDTDPPQPPPARPDWLKPDSRQLYNPARSAKSPAPT